MGFRDHLFRFVFLEKKKNLSAKQVPFSIKCSFYPSYAMEFALKARFLFGFIEGAKEILLNE